MSNSGLHTSDLQDLPLVYRGKVRDIYEIDDTHWLIIATDRVSAFDVILPSVIPGKGKLLTELALFWFDKFSTRIGNHLSDLQLQEVLSTSTDREQAQGRSMLVKKLKPLPIEAVVRNYLIGSGWKDYQEYGAVCGNQLPVGLQQASQLPNTIFTPATKAELGDHDENIDFNAVVSKIGKPLAEQIRSVSMEIYQEAAAYAKKRGIIIADTKFEFGLGDDGELTLMDEILTPDSSRFWEADTWQPGISPASYDKQYVRDYLETLDWDKTDPGPTLPDDVIEGTLKRYREALSRLTS
ncbi:MAG: phosphoribosylaminoimidazolesuccinocarboxamide synthase [Gammaproteobacteria bacterium]|nr:phosphoribosylaminoimidazolesuccinocarboxamide synthase [Gammaproteobacteria bacterium]